MKFDTWAGVKINIWQKCDRELNNKHFLIAVYMQNELTFFAWILNWGDTPNAENRDPKSQRSLEGLNQFASKALGPYFESQGPHFECLRSQLKLRMVLSTNLNIFDITFSNFKLHWI